MRSLISITQLNKNDILNIISRAKQFKNGHVSNCLNSKIIASCFFEASTRTRLSFESAIQRLGGSVIGFADSNTTSLEVKGESLVDTLKIIGGYADCLVIRHHMDGAAKLADEVCGIPVINAGDGANQHPTQTLLDLFAIMDTQNSLDGLKICLMGDLKYSRTIHSLIKALQLFDVELYFVAPKELRLSEEVLFNLKRTGIRYSFHSNIDEIINKIDILYLTRIQKERFEHYEDLNLSYQLNIDLLSDVKSNLKILHPLPRRSELITSIDNTPYAYYFEQAKNGLFVRQAILELLLVN
jgi:aspartate carbamoyltransferase catalytic subunit